MRVDRGLQTRAGSNRVRGAVAAGLAAALLGVCAAPAAGTFPGDDGVIVFTQVSAFGASGELASVNPDGSGLTTLPLGSGNAFATFSASGQTLVFTCGSALCTAKADGTKKEKLPRDGRQRWPSFSGDGKMLAYVKGKGTLVVAKANGKNPTVVEEAGKAWQPEFFPRGEKIAFSKDVGKTREIYSIDADGDNLTRISKGRKGFEDVNPSVHPQGKRIVFERHRTPVSETAHVWSIKADGSGAKRILKNAGTPTFSPSGQRIAYQRIDGSASSIAVAKKNGSASTQLTSGEDTFDLQPTWQPAEP